MGRHTPLIRQAEVHSETLSLEYVYILTYIQREISEIFVCVVLYGTWRPLERYFLFNPVIITVSQLRLFYIYAHKQSYVLLVMIVLSSCTGS